MLASDNQVIDGNGRLLCSRSLSAELKAWVKQVGKEYKSSPEEQTIALKTVLPAENSKSPLAEDRMPIKCSGKLLLPEFRLGKASVSF